MEQQVYEWSTPSAISSAIALGGMKSGPATNVEGRTWHLEPSNGAVGGLIVDGRYTRNFSHDFAGGSWIKIRLQLSGNAQMSFDGAKSAKAVSGARLFLISHQDDLRKTQHFDSASHEKIITMRITCDAEGNFDPTVATGAADREDLSAKLAKSESLRNLALPEILHRQADTIMNGIGTLPHEVTKSRFLTLSEKCLDYVSRSILGHRAEDEMSLTRAQRIVSTALDVFDGNLAAPPTLSRLCRSVGVNRNMLNLAFRQVTGETAFASLRGRQMEVARQMLSSSSLSLTEIAQLVGYSQLPNFSAAYRRTFGLAPSREFERRAR